MKKVFAARVILGGALCVPALFAVPVQADIKYTQVTSMPMGSGQGDKEAMQPLSTITTYVRQGEQRTDTTQQMGPAKLSETILNFCEKKKSVRMDPALKIYTTGSAGTGSDAGDSATQTGKDPEAKETNTAKKGTGKLISTISLQDLGVETVAGYKARHYMITNRLQTSGCAGNSDFTTKQEIWMADVPMPEFSCGPSLVTTEVPGQASREDCVTTYEQKGDVQVYSNALKGIVVKMKMYDAKTNKVTMAQETTMVSLAKLEDGDFAIPAGFRQVSGEEYEKARQQAMMKAITGGAVGGGAGAGDDAGGDEGGDEAGDEAEEEQAEAPKTGKKSGAKDTPKEQDKQKEPNEAEEFGKELEDTAKEQAKEAAKNKVRKKLKLPF